MLIDEQMSLFPGIKPHMVIIVRQTVLPACWYATLNMTYKETKHSIWL